MGDWDWHMHTIIYNTVLNKNLLYSTGNSNQYSVMAYIGREFKKKKTRGNTYMYNDSLSCTPENNSIVNQLYTNKTITKSYITFGPINAHFLELCNDFSNHIVQIFQYHEER